VDGRDEPGHDEKTFPHDSFPLAAQPDALLGFHLGHLKQKDQHAELVAPCQ
jgi:hypothetical protein